MIAFRKSALIYCFLAFSLLAGCGKPEPEKPGDQTDPEGKQDIEAVDGKVRFFLAYKQGGTREALGLDVFTGCKIQVNGKDCIPNRDANGKWFIDVPESTAREYNAARISSTSSRWYGSGTSPFRNVAIPVGQLFRTGSNELGDYPCYARYTQEDGNRLVFNDAFALQIGRAHV